MYGRKVKLRFLFIAIALITLILSVFLVLKSLEEKSVKPPVGLRPRFVDDIRRMDEIKRAVIRYVKDGWEVPPEWIEEYNELAERYPSNSINH